VKFRFEHLADPAERTWVYVGLAEGESAQDALENLRRIIALGNGWYRGSPEPAIEFLMDDGGVTPVNSE
jgi:hypothetical protein